MTARSFPAEFGRYRLTGSLGAGGMAEVFRAETQPVAGITREVAIKRLHYGLENDAALIEMLLDEARIWVRLQHPNIVGVLEFGEHDGDFFLALELVDGVSAAELLENGGPLPVREALCIVERVARALSYAHTVEEKGQPLGIVHRDVKPANVLISRRGEIKLTDFGIARATDRVTRTQVGLIKGSLPYLSPEQVRQEPVDGRSDLFSLGCMLHVLTTGKPLIDATREGLLLALGRGEIPRPPMELPAPVRNLLRALTAPRPEERPSSAQEVLKTLRAILQPETAEDFEPSLGKRVVEAQSRVDTIKAIRAHQSGTIEAATPSPPAEKPPTAKPGARQAVVPKHDVTFHPSWNEPDLSALPEDDQLDAPRPKPKAVARAPEPEVTTPQRAEPESSEPTEPQKVLPRPARPRATRPPMPAITAKTPRAATAAAGGSGNFSRVFEIAPRFTGQTGRALRDAPPRFKAAIAALGVAVIVLLAILVPAFFGKARAAGCSSLKAGAGQRIQERGFGEAPQLVQSLGLRCPGDSDARRMRTRLLELSGNSRGAIASLPSPADRSPEDALVVAALELADGEWKNAEADAWKVAREGRGAAAPAARCLAAAAAIDQEHPERVDIYLAGTNDDCAKILKAAALMQQGKPAQALSFLSRPPQDSHLDAAWESALGVMHLYANDMESAAADAKTADDRAAVDPLGAHPWVWYTIPSPRGGEAPVLHVTGPSEDAGLYTHVLLGDAARVRGNLELALRIYDEAGNRGGRSAFADLRAASIFAKQGKPPLARARLNRALQVSPTWAPALVALALIEEQDSDPKVRQFAAPHAAAALTTQPENRDAHRIAGRAP